MPTITIRVSAEERTAIESAASRDGLTISAYIRETLLLHEENVLAQIEDHELRLSELERFARLT